MNKSEAVEQSNDSGAVLTIINTDDFDLTQDAQRSIAATFSVVAGEAPNKVWRGADLLALEKDLPLEHPESAELAHIMLQNMAKLADANPTSLTSATMLKLSEALERISDEEHKAFTDMMTKLLTQASDA